MINDDTATNLNVIKNVSYHDINNYSDVCLCHDYVQLEHTAES